MLMLMVSFTLSPCWLVCRRAGMVWGGLLDCHYSEHLCSSPGS